MADHGHKSTPRVAAHRKRVYDDEEAHEALKKKDRKRKHLKRQEIKKNKTQMAIQRKKNSTYQRIWRQKIKVRRARLNQQDATNLKSPSPQSVGKAYYRVMKKMPKSPTKAAAVVDQILCKMSPTKKRLLLKLHDLNFKNMERKKRSDAFSEKQLQDAADYYVRDEITYLLPGKKDFKSVKMADGKRVHVQKRVLMCNLREVYALYEMDTETPISFTKFVSLRPKHVMLSGQRDHDACMCEYHENLDMCLQGLKKVINTLPNSTTDLKNQSLCENYDENCVDRKCKKCGVKYLDTNFKSVKQDTAISYYQWIRMDDEKIKKDLVETDIQHGIEILKQQLSTFARHCYNVKKQHENLHHLKEILLEEDIIIQEDFAENYALKQQREIMKAHWSPQQVTVFTAVVYYKEDGERKHISFAIVSDDLDHGKKAIYSYNKTLLNEIKSKFARPIRHVYYWSDGCGGQFKNKYNLQSNLINHYKDHGCTASWDFFATAHGKGPVDGVGGEVKRSVWRCTLQAKDVPTNAYEFYQVAKREAKAINLLYVVSDKIQETSELVDLESRWEACKVIPGTRKLHSFHIDHNSKVIAKVNSTYKNKQLANKLLKEHHTEININASTSHMINPDSQTQSLEGRLGEGDWIGVLFNVDWWPGQVIQLMPEQGTMEIKFLFKPIAHNKFKTFAKPELETINTTSYLIALPGDPSPVDSSARFFAYDKDIANKVASIIENL